MNTKPTVTLAAAMALGHRLRSSWRIEYHAALQVRACAVDRLKTGPTAWRLLSG